jgi:hypothetical protein
MGNQPLLSATGFPVTLLSVALKSTRQQEEVTNMDQTERKVLGDIFDRTIRSMNGLPEVISTKATTVRALSSVLELSQTFIVQTYRQKEAGDTIFIEYIGVEGSLRLALLPVVSDVIARQRDAITG